MSLFGPSKKELLEWQTFVTGKPSSKLLMNKAQLKSGNSTDCSRQPKNI